MIFDTSASFENHVSFEGDEAIAELRTQANSFENHVSFELGEAKAKLKEETD